MDANTESTVFYLFANANGALAESSGTVFYKASNKTLAEALCKLFRTTYSAGYQFSAKPANDFPFEEQIRCDETLGALEIYSDPDPGVYDPEPPKELHQLAQFAVRANEWQELIERNGKSRLSEEPQEQMSEEDRHDSGLIVFWLLAQAYYKILEQTISQAHLFVQLDLKLNQSYLWVIGNLSNLLENHPDLQDFPIQFKPIFEDLYPSTISDIDWVDSVQIEAEEFLSAAQRYFSKKPVRQPRDGSAGHVFIELFRPSIEKALADASAYNDRIRKHAKRLFKKPKQKASIPKAQECLLILNGFRLLSRLRVNDATS